MAENKEIIQAIIEGVQEVKGKGISVVDLTKLSDTPCEYFVICEGGSTTQVNSIAESVREYVRKTVKVKPYVVDGFENCVWIAMDYGQILVHIFLRETREFYDIEHLWNNATITEVPDLD